MQSVKRRSSPSSPMPCHAMLRAAHSMCATQCRDAAKGQNESFSSSLELKELVKRVVSAGQMQYFYAYHNAMLSCPCPCPFLLNQPRETQNRDVMVVEKEPGKNCVAWLQNVNCVCGSQGKRNQKFTHPCSHLHLFLFTCRHRCAEGLQGKAVWQAAQSGGGENCGKE